MNAKPFATGHCLCGAVSYRINAQPVGTGQCHCKDCQRASGTGHVSLAFFKQEDVDFSGEIASFAVTADSGNIYTRHFCPKCGGRLYNENSRSVGYIHIAIGSLDDNSWFAPERVLYVKDKPAWDLTSTEIPNFDAMPPPRPPSAREIESS